MVDHGIGVHATLRLLKVYFVLLFQHFSDFFVIVVSAILKISIHCDFDRQPIDFGEILMEDVVFGEHANFLLILVLSVLPLEVFFVVVQHLKLTESVSCVTRTELNTASRRPPGSH